MYLGNLRDHLSWLTDAASAGVAAFVGYVLAASIWNWSVVETIGALLHISSQEWIFILLALNGPPALLGLLSGRLARRAKTPFAAWVAGVSGCALSLATGLAFGWWLSHVL